MFNACSLRNSLKVFLFSLGSRSITAPHRIISALRCAGFGIAVALLLAAWPISGYAQSVVSTVAAGTNPGPLVENPLTNLVYVGQFSGQHRHGVRRLH